MKIPLPETLKRLMLAHGGSGAVAANVNGKIGIVVCCNENDLPPAASETSCNFELYQQGLVRWVVDFCAPNGACFTLDAFFDLTQAEQKSKLNRLVKQNNCVLYFFENRTFYHIASKIFPIQMLDRIKIKKLTNIAQKLPLCNQNTNLAKENQQFKQVDSKHEALQI